MKKKLMIYVHIPFCVKKCNYCDFLSFPCCKPETMSEYVSALISNITGNLPGEDNIDPGEYEVSSIFFGGGTPSLIEPELIISILNRIKEIYYCSPEAEITIEANPGTLRLDKLIKYRNAGINRLSMGVQSFDDKELKILGRIHNSETACDNYYEARRAGFENINLDLISAIPGQSVDSWKKTLNRAIELNPEHISAYSLIIEPGTRFGDYFDNNKTANITSNISLVDKEEIRECYFDLLEATEAQTVFPPLPTEEEERSMYVDTEHLLSEAGYEHYEISNYARPGLCCEHNIGYWTGREYLGLGLGASSYIKSSKYKNDYLRFSVTSDPDEFIKAPNTRILTEIVSVREAMEEYMFLGLRMIKGVSISEFRNRFGHSMEEIYSDVLRKYLKLGLLLHEGDYIRLSTQGISISNTIMSEFLL